MARKLTDAQRVLRYVATADVTEVRQVLDLARVVVQAREGPKPRREPTKRRPIRVSIPPNED